ncbi:MAG TPA: hypothetical protein VFP59_16000 [Candidatus Angelobacter sp.]|nr:hypothetical protein [Candidatus Angelobacter sp.]
MKDKDAAILIAFLVLLCIVIGLSNRLNELERGATRKVNELDQSVTRLSGEINEAKTQISSMLQPKATATVGGFGCGSALS